MMENNSLNRNCILIIVFCIVGIVFSNVTFLLKTPVVADELISEDINADEEGLFIPIEDGVSFEDIIVKCDYKFVNLSIPGTDKSFYYENSLVGDGKSIAELRYGYVDGRNLFDIRFDEICECRVEPSEGGIKVIVEPVMSRYSKIVFIDPAHGGDDEGTVSYSARESYVNYNTAQQIKNILSSNEIGIFISHDLDQNVSVEDREKMASELAPDLIVKIECKGDARTRITHGMEYKANAEGREIFGRAFADNGLDIKYTGVSSNINDIPILQIYLGYLTNKMDADSLLDDKHVEEIAEKIAASIEEYFDMK